jgi:hypothetical protein
MRISNHVKIWASGILGGVSLLLLINLVLDFGEVRAGAPRPTLPPASPGEERRLQTDRGADEDARYLAQVRLDVLEDLQARPLPDIVRNPFEFEAPKRTPQQIQQAAAAAAAAQQGAASNQPPPPPPVPLKAFGYGEKTGGGREAYLSDDEQIYIVHEGESVGSRFKVLKILPAAVEVQDDASHQTVQLPIPQ